MSVFLLSKLPILKKVYFAKCSSQPKIHFATGGKMYYLTVENSFDSAHFYTVMKENVQIYMVIVGE